MPMSLPIKAIEVAPNGTQPSGETREEKLAKYSSPEFTQALTEMFHRAKRHAIQADRDAIPEITNALSYIQTEG